MVWSGLARSISVALESKGEGRNVRTWEVCVGAYAGGGGGLEWLVNRWDKEVKLMLGRGLSVEVIAAWQWCCRICLDNTREKPLIDAAEVDSCRSRC